MDISIENLQLGSLGILAALTLSPLDTCDYALFLRILSYRTLTNVFILDSTFYEYYLWMGYQMSGV